MRRKVAGINHRVSREYLEMRRAINKSIFDDKRDKQERKAFILLEYIMYFGISLLVISVLLISFRYVLLKLTLDNEVYALRKHLEYAQDYAYTYQKKILLRIINNKEYAVIAETGANMKLHKVSGAVIINGNSVTFTPNFTPSVGTTITVVLGKLIKKITVDPTTGRIKVL